MPTRSERRRNIAGHAAMNERSAAELRRRIPAIRPSEREWGLVHTSREFRRGNLRNTAYVNRNIGGFREMSIEPTSMQNRRMAEGDRVRSMNGRTARPVTRRR